MTTTNKQRRTQHMQRVRDRQAVRAAHQEAKRVEAIRADCLRKLEVAGFDELDLRRLEREAEHGRVPLPWRVANFISESQRPASEPVNPVPVEPRPYPPRRLSRNPALLSFIALSLLGSNPRG